MARARIIQQGIDATLTSFSWKLWTTIVSPTLLAALRNWWRGLRRWVIPSAAFSLTLFALGLWVERKQHWLPMVVRPVPNSGI